MASVTHPKVSVIADDPAAVAAGEVVPSDWNALHTVVLVDADIPATIARDTEVTAAVAAHESDTTSVHGITDTSTLYLSGGTDVAVADGGTGGSTAAAARTNLGLVIGTDVQAQDAELAAIAGLTSVADRVPYFTGSGTAALATQTAFARTLLDDIDAATALATLGAASAASVTAIDGWASRASTFMVAAVDAPASLIAAADYICDGVADEVQINAAIAALPATGGVVQLSSGTFTCADSVSITTSNAVLRGMGRATVVKITAAVTGKHIINVVGASEAAPIYGVNVRDLKVLGYGNTAGNGAAFDHGVSFRYVKSGRIENVWAEDATWSGINLRDSFSCLVANVTIERGASTNGGWYGVTLDNSAATSKKTGHVINGVVADSKWHGFATQTADDWVCSNLTVVNPSGDFAIDVTTSKRGVISNWAVVNALGGAVFVEIASDRILIANGVLTTTGAAFQKYGIEVSASTNVTVVNCDLDLTGQTTTTAGGVKFDATSHYGSCIGVKARNTSGRGFYFESSANYALVQGCEANTCATKGYEIGTGTKARIIDNYAKSCTSDGFVLANTRSEIIGNVADTNGGAGFFMQYMDDSVVALNIAHANTGYGIDQGAAAANSERNIMALNQVSGNTAGSIRVSTATGANINTFRYNTGYVTTAKGATSVADGGTVTHGLATTPTRVNANPSTASEMVSITALGATTFTVAIKKFDGTAGTTAVVYWEAEV